MTEFDLILEDSKVLKGHWCFEQGWKWDAISIFIWPFLLKTFLMLDIISHNLNFISRIIEYNR